MFPSGGGVDGGCYACVGSVQSLRASSVCAACLELLYRMTSTGKPAPNRGKEPTAQNLQRSLPDLGEHLLPRKPVQTGALGSHLQRVRARGLGWDPKVCILDKVPRDAEVVAQGPKGRPLKL